LFDWLYARKNNGTFVLRIEDTDVERSSQEMTQGILDAMSWLGLHWDEGPHMQSAGFEKHRRAVQGLLDSGHAYYCFCSPELLDQKRKEGM
jgi:glutamyl-tRNA synthetase